MIVLYIISFLIVLLSLSVHEFAHAYVAYLFGDRTAYEQKRMTLNPIKHIDPIGTIVLPLILLLGSKITQGFIPVFGYAKPVPIDPNRFSHFSWGLALTALAGPFSNIILAYSAYIILLLTGNTPFSFVLLSIMYINVLLAVFNMLPIPPLDGSKILIAVLPQELAVNYQKLAPYGFILIIFILRSNIIDQLFSIVFRFLFPVLA